MRSWSVSKCTALCFCAAALATARPGFAQPYQEEPPWTMTPEQLEDAGWEHEGRRAQGGSPAGGALALTVGTIAHGVGHLYAGDERTGKQLLITEGVSLGLLGTGILLNTLTDSDGRLAPLYRTATVLGAGLFVTTWLLDVIGTFKGTGNPLPPNSGTLAQVRVSAAYTRLFAQGLPLEDAAEIGVQVDLGAFFVHPRGAVGLDLGYFSFGAATGVRFGLGRRELSYLDLTLEADEVVFADAGFGYESASASLGLSLDLGDVFAHLDGIVYTNRLGVGAQFFRFDFNDGRPLSGDSVVSMLVAETSLSADPIRGLLVELGYLQRPDALVGKLSQSLGAFFATLTYALTAELDLFVDARFGQGVQLFTGTAYRFWPRSRPSD